MSGSTIGIVVIPIVIAVALAAWIVMVYRANRHPRTGRGDTPDQEISGSVFRGDPRQMSPRRDAPPEEARRTGDGTGPQP